MLDINFIRNNLELVKQGAKKKHIEINWNEFIALDNKRKELQQMFDQKRSEQNKEGEKIARLQENEKKEAINKILELKGEIKKTEKELKEVKKKWQYWMWRIPQVPDESVPTGKSDEDNVPIKTWGEKTKFDFKAKSHIDLMVALNMVDFKRGAKIHGFRGYYLKGDGAKLSWAIWNYANEFFGNKGFIPVLPPVIVNEENLYGTGHLPNEAEDIFTTQDGQCLIGTAEIPITGYHSGEVLDNKELPIKYLGFSPCYRREAGSYGKDTKGLIRVHEFYKMEQLILCKNNKEETEKWHQWLNRNTEEFIETLDISYQTVVNCTGDLGLGQVKKYDIELWVPEENKYREISSASSFYDFQARRFNIKYKDEKDNEVKFIHTLNSTAIPTPRILVSLIENFQTKDGKIKIPEVLKKYLNNKEFIG